MTALRTISKTGAELQDIVQAIDELTGEIYIPASAFQIIDTAALWTAIGSSAAAGGYAMDAAAAEGVNTSIRLSNDLPMIDYTKTVDIYIQWSAAATSGDVVWDIDYVVAALGEDLGAAVTNATVTDTAAGTADYASEAPVISIAASVLADTDVMHFTVRREGADGSDTMTGDASFNGVRIVYTTNPNIV